VKFALRLRALEFDSAYRGYLTVPLALRLTQLQPENAGEGVVEGAGRAPSRSPILSLRRGRGGSRRMRPLLYDRRAQTFYGAGGAPVSLLGERSAMTPPAMTRRIPIAIPTPWIQPNPGSPIPSGLANAAINATTTPTMATTIPICLLDMAAEDYLAEGGGSTTVPRFCNTGVRSLAYSRSPAASRASLFVA
jgi:hypothetical protein